MGDRHVDSNTPVSAPTPIVSEDVREGVGWLPPGAFAWLSALWFWVIPSVWFWGLSESQGILLPYVPHYLWVWPGELWQTSPWLFTSVCLVLSGALFAGARRWPRLARRTRVLAVVFASVVAAIHALWGGAIVSQ